MPTPTPALAALLLGLGTTAHAADHAEAPLAAADPAADIADFYAWHTTDAAVFVLTFAPLTAAGGSPTYDADVLYGIHLDLSGNGTSDRDIWVQFGQNDVGGWGVRTTFGETVEEFAAGETFEGAAFKVWTGLADDPFFFDLEGYQDTLTTGDLAFDSSRDSLAGTNVTAIVVEVALADIQGSSAFQTWATTARK